MVPGADPQSHVLAAVAQLLVVGEHLRQEHVVPAGQHRHRNAEIRQDRAEVGGRPVRVARLVMLDPVPVEADRVPDGHRVGVEQREMGVRRGQGLAGPQHGTEQGQRLFLVLDGEHPAESPVQGEGAARVVVRAAVGAPDGDRHGLELRRPGRREGELRETEVAPAEGADRAVGPGLPDDPVGGRTAVGGFGVELDAAAGAKRAPGGLDNGVVAALGEQPGDGAVGAAAPVGGAHQDDGERLARPGQVDVGEQGSTVRGTDRCISLYVDVAGRRGPGLHHGREQAAGHCHVVL